MRRLIGIGSVIAVMLYFSCKSPGGNVGQKKDNSDGSLIKKILEPFRSGVTFFPSKEAKLAKDLYNAVYGRDISWVQEILLEGANPNYCDGECGWVDSNPLNVVAESFDNTYWKKLKGGSIPIQTSDVTIFNLLIKAGGDIHRRPFIWNRVFIYNNNNINNIKRVTIDIDGHRKEDMTPARIQEEIESFVIDANRLLKAFLEAGADPDMLGHSYPFSSEAADRHPPLTDQEASEYFAKGSRAINVAIEKGIIWESQVDLLLKYTKLDEESLKAAERSKDQKMIDKIKVLWEKQQGK